MANIRFLVLNDTQAATVRGNEYGVDATLEPRLMDNKAGMTSAGSPYTPWGGSADFYVLNYRVMFDPDFASVVGYLSQCPDAILDTNVIFLPPPEE